MTLTESQSTVIISGSLLPTKRKHAIINSNAHYENLPKHKTCLHNDALIFYKQFLT